MKKNIAILLCILLIYVIPGCSREHEKIDVTKNQLIEITAADNKIIRQITDNTEIQTITDNEMEQISDYKQINSVPPDAEKLYNYITYEEITEPIYLKDGKPWISVWMCTLYQNGEDYYVSEGSLNENEDTEAGSISEIPDSTANYLIMLASGQWDVQDRNDIFSTWNTTPIPDINIPDELNFKKEVPDSALQQDNYEEYPFKDIEPYDYKGVAAVSKYQKIEKTAKDNSVLFSTTDINIIVDILNGLEMNHWKRVETIPQNATELCTVIRYAHPKKKPGKELAVQERLILFQSKENYYITSIPAEIELPTDYDYTNLISHYKIPVNAGEHLENLNS